MVIFPGECLSAVIFIAWFVQQKATQDTNTRKLRFFFFFFFKPESTEIYPGCFLSKDLILHFIVTRRSGEWKEIGGSR